MKKKNYEAIAEILQHYWRITKDPVSLELIENIGDELSCYFETTSPTFDPVRFREIVEGENNCGFCGERYDHSRSCKEILKEKETIKQL